MSELDKVIDQIESHAALAREQKLRAEIERLRRELNLLRELHHSAEKEVNELRAVLRDNLIAMSSVEPTTEIAAAKHRTRRALEGK